MSRPLRFGLITLAALAALVAGYLASLWLRDAQLVDQDAALVDFALPDLDGKERWLSEWQGKIVVLNFWATWCGPCKEEMPLLVAAHKRYQEQGVRVVGVAIDTRDAVAGFAKEFHIDFPLLIGDEAGISVMSRFGNSRGALPYTVIIRPDGTIAAKKLGAYHGNELSAQLDTLVKPDSRTILPN